MEDACDTRFSTKRREEAVYPPIAKSPAMLAVLKRIQRAAEVDSPVLIWGEPGSGKKMVAEVIHRRSRRAHGPFVVVSTGNRRGSSPEDELFGAAEPPGNLVAADGGTLLIDEITGLSPTRQAKLLAAAEGRHLEEPWGFGRQPVDFRLMATTREDLAQSVKRGSVRADLYYRLTVVTIRVPPLRERKEDIPCLVEQMLGELCSERGRRVPAVDPELVQHLAERAWSGNGRELRECLQRMVVAEDAETLRVKHLQSPSSQNGRNTRGVPSAEEIDTLADLERTAVMRALTAHQGNRTQAARALGISVRTLQRKLKHWGA